MASTYRWIGGTGSPDIATNWTLVAGAGNPSGVPDTGDTAIVPTGTVQTGPDSTLNSNTVVVGGTAGLAGITFTGGPAISTGNPSIDQNSVVTSQFAAPPGNPESTLLRTAGTFVNQGSIAADGSEGSTFTIAIQQNGTDPGYFLNDGQMSVEAGNTMSIVAGANAELINASAIFVNGGSLNISADASAIAGGVAPVRGDIVIRSGGQVEINTGYPAGITGLTPGYDFVDGTGLLKLDQPAQFGGRILGFQAGNTIDLVGIGAITQVIYGSDHVLELQNAGGTTVASLVFSTGVFSVGTFAVSGGVAGSFGIASAGSDVLLTTSATNIAWTNGAGGLWTTGSNWSGGLVPGTGDTAVIGDGTAVPYVVQTGTTSVSVGSLMLANQAATLQVDTGLTVTAMPLQHLIGTIDVVSGATLQAPSLTQIGGDNAVLSLHTGSTLILTGGPSVGIAANLGTVAANANAHSALLLNGSVLVDGATINAGPTQSSTAFTGGYIQIGRDGSDSADGVVVTNAATVTDTYALLYSGPTSSGRLTLSGPNTVWTDAGDPADTLTTRGYISVGVNDIANSPPLEGSAELLVTNGATLVDISRAYIGDSAGGRGTVTVSDGGQWRIGNAASLTGALRVGLNGDGTLLVLNDTTIAGNGGTVTVGTGNQSFLQNGTTVTQNAALDIGTNAGSFGTVVVAGSGAELSTAGSNIVGDAVGSSRVDLQACKLEYSIVSPK